MTRLEAIYLIRLAVQLYAEQQESLPSTVAQPRTAPATQSVSTSQVPRIRTQQITGWLNTMAANDLFDRLLDQIDWESANSIIARGNRPTRPGVDHRVAPRALVAELESLIERAAAEMATSMQPRPTRWMTGQIYINLYRNGQDWAPSHSHNSAQLVISLGATRTLRVGARDYSTGNGDLILFGRSSHSLLTDPDCQQPRISIASFNEFYL